jgi:hypothetical protein
MRKNKYLLTIFMFLVCIIPTIVSGATLEMTGDGVGIRKGPGTNYDRYGYTGAVGETYTLKSTTLVKTEKGCDSGYWFNIDYKGNNAYICSSYGIIKVDEPLVITDEAKTQCENELKKAGFPVSYWSQLCQLKIKHPSWTFESVYTGYDFASAVAKEQCRGSISQSSKAEFQDNTCGRSYDSGYTGASQTANAYYMNPLNFLNESDVFMFESGYINEGVKNYYPQLAQKISNSTLLNHIPDLPTFINVASNESKASATFLAARIRVELGKGLLTSGTYAGQLQSALSGNYTTRYKYYYDPSLGWSKDKTGRKSVDNYYNFYNIGASDGDGVTQKALAYAYKYGWGGTGNQYNDRQTAVTGGAGWVYRNYINAGQQTMYFNKFNFNPETTNHNHSIASHEYMTNVQAPLSEGRTLYNAYKSLNILDLPYKFVIPVFANLNADIQNSDGGATGDTNNEHTELSPSTMVVSSGYTLDGAVINNVSKETTINDFIGRITSQGGNVEVYANNNLVYDGIIGTGMTIRIKSSSGESTYTTMVKGDSSGDGKINALDLLYVQKQILGEKDLSGVYLTASDVSGDGKVNALDLLYIQKNILGLKDI